MQLSVAILTIINAFIGLFTGMMVALVIKIALLGYWKTAAVFAGVIVIVGLWEYLDERMMSRLSLLLSHDKAGVKRMSARSTMPTWAFVAGLIAGLLAVLILSPASVNKLLNLL